MASIRITKFGGLRPELSPRLGDPVHAQIAHNCLLLDGTLRPQAEWVLLNSTFVGGDGEVVTRYVGIAYDRATDTAHFYAGHDPISLEGEPFGSRVTLAADYPLGENGEPDEYYSRVSLYPTGLGSNWDSYMAGVRSTVLSGEVVYTRSYDSSKPVNRMYAASRVRKEGRRAEESTLKLLTGQSPTDIVYEGDLVEIEISTGGGEDHVTHYRLYRSVSGLDTGDNVNNVLDTEWHLVAELPIGAFTYVDGNAATAAPLDVNYSSNFHVPVLYPKFLGLSESGWFVAASPSGDIQVSEKYLHHAWPVDNHLRLQGEEIIDMAVTRDNAYIGTGKYPYVVSLADGEAGLQASATPFSEAIPCLPGSMTAAAGGAIYASRQGLVGLSREGQRVLTRELANGGDILYRHREDTNGPQGVIVTTASIGTTQYGAYYQGQYFGFCKPLHIPAPSGGSD